MKINKRKKEKTIRYEEYKEKRRKHKTFKHLKPEKQGDKYVLEYNGRMYINEKINDLLSDIEMVENG